MKEYLKKIKEKGISLAKKIGSKMLEFAKEQLAKIRHAIKQKKQHGRPLVLELPLYILKDAFLGFYKGLKEGYIMYTIRRNMKDREVV